ncbi:MAG TPA: hypothetical protein PLB89_07435 [Flavobacteriales bacterium]|nr:hypothetical protein [Flavobacteriales bacterium]
MQQQRDNGRLAGEGFTENLVLAALLVAGVALFLLMMTSFESTA